MNNLLMVFDVESIGLYGEGWAVGWVVLNDGEVISEGCAACPQEKAKGTDSDRKWVAENCPPLEITHDSPKLVRDEFWKAWISVKESNGTIWADCSYPVEAGFLRDCVADDPESRTWNAPYPLHEIATLFEMTGMDALGKHDRLPNEPEHHPLGDARQSARLLWKARLSIH